MGPAIPVMRATLIPVAEPVIPEKGAAKKQHNENEPVSGSNVSAILSFGMTVYSWRNRDEFDDQNS